VVIDHGLPATGAAAPAAATVRDGASFSERAWGIGLTILRRDSTVRRALALADVLALACALLAAAAAGSTGLLLPAVVAFPALILVAKVGGLYDRDANLLRRSTLDEAPALFQLATGQALVLWVVLFALVAVFRALAREAARRVSPAERCLFVGDAASAEEFRAELDASRGVNAEVVSLVPVEGGPPPGANGEWAAGLEAQIGRLAAQHGAQRVVLAPELGASEELVTAGRQMLGVRRFHITWSSRVIKRGFDVAGAMAGLVLLAPMMLAIAIAIRLDSPGPVLYRQSRAGRDGREFRMLKFRSMVDGADAMQRELAHLSEFEGIFKLRDDPRVTRVGRFLRRWSLDELPQLVNVLRGEMSLVGPRPLPLAEDRLVEGWHRRRLDLRPGITGPWQILGPTRVPLREMVNLDNQYVAEWSLWTDVRILLLTVPHVLGRRGV
jgi:lipopolysaccharide/colanic/teichoic acid biosynthesis glycosyltransferase